jgi:hypothetical protein
MAEETEDERIDFSKIQGNSKITRLNIEQPNSFSFSKLGPFSSFPQT